MSSYYTQVFSNLSIIKVEFTKFGEAFKRNRWIDMTPKNPSAILNTKQQNQNFQVSLGVIKGDHINQSTSVISTTVDSVIQSINHGKHLRYNFVLKNDDLKEKDKLLFDLSFSLISELPDTLLWFRESRTISLQALATLPAIHFTSFQTNIRYNINTTISKDTDVRFRNITELCQKEEEFVTKRKTFVFNQMRDKLKLQTNLQLEKDAPNIAVIGSGGGMRAVIGMCGAMTALQTIGILDCTMYTAGLSGSAWYLMALFANDKQHSPKEVNGIIRQKLKNFRNKELFDIWFQWKIATQLCKLLKVHESTFSITDSFGELIGKLLIEEEHVCERWCDQKAKLEDGSVPLPLLAALHVRSEKTIHDYSEWIEFSPYEVSIPKYGAAIDMANFGDEFYGGFILRQHRESSIRHLQGICGSAFTKVRDYRPTNGKWYMFLSGIKNRMTSFFNSFDTTFVGKVPNWLLGIPGFKPLGVCPDTAITEIDKIDFENDEMMLVDAGISFNSPYPTVLHPSRKIDIILSFDFSQRFDRSWPFTQLEEAERWAKERCVPFPKIYPQLFWIKKEWKKGNYKEMYVFPGDNSPTIVHFVNINNSFRKECAQDGVEHDFDIFPKYWTGRFKYSEKDFNQLCLLVEHNVKKNRKEIRRTIKKVINQNRNRYQEVTRKKDKISK